MLLFFSIYKIKVPETKRLVKWNDSNYLKYSLHYNKSKIFNVHVQKYLQQ